MASTLCQTPAVEYFSSPANRSQINNLTTYDWDSSPYFDQALANSDSCDSVSSPTSPDSLVFPQSSYNLPRDETRPNIKIEKGFNFGTFEDWMRWDDPSDAALSPTSDFFPELKVEPPSPNMGGLELEGSGIGNTNITDDCVVFGEDPINEEPLFQTPGSLITPPLTEVPPREGLYSTPLSWSRPTLERRSNSYNGILTPQEEAQLRIIAMPPQSQQEQYPTSPNSSSSSPEPSENNRRKRKSSIEEDYEEDSPPPANGRHPPVKKTAHNMIEKRYRTNLNDKIAALRDSVPSLRVMSKNSRGEEFQEDLQGLTPAHKLNKATVLSKATEYIAHLEKRNRYLAKENAALKSRVDAFEILVMSRQPSNQRPQLQSHHHGSGNRQSMSGPSRGYSVEGMM